MLRKGISVTCILIYVFGFDDDRVGCFVIRIRSGVRKDIRREADDITKNFNSVVCLVGEDVHIVITIAEKQVVLERAIYDSDLSQQGEFQGASAKVNGKVK